MAGGPSGAPGATRARTRGLTSGQACRSARVHVLACRARGAPAGVCVCRARVEVAGRYADAGQPDGWSQKAGQWRSAVTVVTRAPRWRGMAPTGGRSSRTTWERGFSRTPCDSPSLLCTPPRTIRDGLDRFDAPEVAKRSTRSSCGAPVVARDVDLTRCWRTRVVQRRLRHQRADATVRGRCPHHEAAPARGDANGPPRRHRRNAATRWARRDRRALSPRRRRAPARRRRAAVVCADALPAFASPIAIPSSYSSEFGPGKQEPWEVQIEGAIRLLDHIFFEDLRAVMAR